MSSVLQSTVGSVGAGLNWDRLKFWGIQSGVSVLDQGLTSGANFALNLLLARWLTAESYGAFAVAFATLLFVSGYHNVLSLEPLSVFGPATYSLKIVAYFRAQIRLHFLLTACLSTLFLLSAATMSILRVDHELVLAIVASAVAFPLVLFLWLVRRMCYAVNRPAVAAWASAVYLVALVGGLVLIHGLKPVTPAAALLLMAAGSLVATFVPLRKLSIVSAESESAFGWSQLLRENWNYGRWLVASTTLYSIASQIQTYLAAGLLGLGAAGVLRAMQMPSLVMTQIVSAISLLLLPTMAREYGRGHLSQLRRKAVYASAILALMALSYVAVLGVFAKPIEKLMYASKFSSDAWLIPVLGLVPVCTGFAAGFSIALRASQKPHFDLLANAVSAPVGLASAVLFIKFWGLGGAGISMVAGFAVYAAVFFGSFLRSSGEADLGAA